MKTAAKSTCPIGHVAELLSDTWTMLILHYLNEGPKRFCELEDSLSHISTRTLTLKLKKLSDQKLVAKSKEGSYSTTERGKGIKLIEKAMINYQKKYL